MKEFEFTKGEWEVSTNTIRCNHSTLSVSYLKNFRLDNHGKMLKDYESLANTRLMAAAPNLLYALIDLVEIVDTLPEDKSILTALNNAKKAIDKATK